MSKHFGGSTKPAPPSSPRDGLGEDIEQMSKGLIGGR